MSDDDILTVQQLAGRLGEGAKVGTLRKMQSAGLIPSIPYGPKLGARTSIEPEVREAWAQLSAPLSPSHPRREKAAETNSSGTKDAA